MDSSPIRAARSRAPASAFAVPPTLPLVAKHFDGNDERDDQADHRPPPGARLVLDDDDGVAEIAQSRERAEQAAHLDAAMHRLLTDLRD